MSRFSEFSEMSLLDVGFTDSDIILAQMRGTLLH